MYTYLDNGVAIRNEEQGKKTEKSIFSLVEPSSSYKKDRIGKLKYEGDTFRSYLQPLKVFR